MNRRNILKATLGGVAFGIMGRFDSLLDLKQPIGSLRVSQRRIVFPHRGKHNGFPGLCRRPNGSFVGVFRQGSSHGSRDGRIIRQFYSNSDGTPAGSRALFGNRYRGKDVRDPSVTLLRDGRIALTFFVYDPAASRVIGSFVAFSSNGGNTFGVPIRMSIDKIVSAPIVELPNGELVCPMYNRNAFLQCSRDRGRTWFTRSTPLTPSQTGGDLCEEPTATLISNGRLVMLIRTAGAHHVWRMSSPDGGITWGGRTRLWRSSSRINMVQLGPAKYVAFYRSVPDPTKAYAVFSNDSFATYQPGAFLISDTVGQNTYTAPVVLSANSIALLISHESRNHRLGTIVWEKVAYTGV